MATRDGRAAAARGGNRGKWLIIGLAVLAAVSEALPVAAAVRECRDPTYAEAVGRNEAEAKRKALEGWRLAALKHGDRFSGWTVAADKQLVCAPAEGLTVCRAAARPCTIEQAPPKDTFKPRPPKIDA